jgi:hypothetical protein
MGFRQWTPEKAARQASRIEEYFGARPCRFKRRNGAAF